MDKPKIDKLRFHLKLDDGELKGNWGNIKMWLSKFQNCAITMTLERVRSIRSDKQNRYYWAYITLIATTTGESRDYLHIRFGEEFLSIGEKILYGKVVRIVKSTTRLSKGEFVEYLAQIEALTETPLPDIDKYYDDVTQLITDARKKVQVMNESK